MFELEVGTNALPLDELPSEVLDAFRATGRSVEAFSLTPWEEHCTECAMPECYRTCDLYSPRSDGKCRRFIRGVEIVPLPEHPQGYVAKVAFKRWGQLLAYTNGRLLSAVQAVQIERRVRKRESFAAGMPGGGISIAGRKGLPARLTRRWKKKVVAGAGQPIAREPDRLLLEVYNPSDEAVRLSLSVSNPGNPPFQRLFELNPGYAALEVPLDAITPFVSLEQEIHFTLNPNILSVEDEGLTLYFGLMAWVRRRSTSAKVKTIKVAVWDLDNTLWKGTLIEDGVDALELKEDAMEVVKELDRRGIVNSILSKNHPEDGMAALKRFGVEEYFVFPRIGWTAKGAVMNDLIASFNVGADTFAFIDDQAFERDQVTGTNPGVRAYDQMNLLALLDRPEFQPAQSTESASRRQFYAAEETRVKDQAGVGGDYLEFLATCEMVAEIRQPDEASMARVNELVQRTNQLNYSGQHYGRDEIAELLEDPRHEAFTVSCVDKYGEYGTVGFLLVDKDAGALRDAMFSCRIQFKRVEHAVLAFLLHRQLAEGDARFDAHFRETVKNASAAQVFEDLGFDEAPRDGDKRLFTFDLAQAIPDEGIVTIRFEGVPWEPSKTNSVG